ncbi:CDP-alcohol phosphatidyltransferase family protein (plasmid) [Pseudomonas sp. FeN3W]|nr:CDP-alcohol phosphatidyltransferase family protein [Pseudomonas sp. FeN3W]
MEDNRRPIKSRSQSWAIQLTAYLIRRNITPNQISVASIGFAALASICMTLSTGFMASVLAIAFVQMRLVCNLLDGMVAIEGGKSSAAGSLYNEFPDRIADTLLIVSLGYAVALPELGWFAALAAALTAYVRVFGGSVGLKQAFTGPMAKQHRMAALTVGLGINLVEAVFWGTHNALVIALGVIALGSALTCITRTLDIARELKESQ